MNSVTPTLTTASPDSVCVKVRVIRGIANGWEAILSTANGMGLRAMVEKSGAFAPYGK